uniref:Uncharacterized protein n=1 Tax=Tanacetum cinerariifolium TaxID=118510 RepID=A0A6L2P6R2_TANCI|nr:hypothetical protein [Tanacetum cinerariifolium]
MPTAPAPPSPTNAPSPPPQDPTPTHHASPPQDQPSTSPASPPQEQLTITSESSMSLLITLLETCVFLSKKVAKLEQDTHTQALEILQLKKRVKKLEKKKRSKSLRFKRLRRVGRGKIEAIDADEDITLVDMEKDEEVVTMDVELQGRIYQEEVNAASKGVSAAEPTIFDDEEYDEKEENIDWNAVAEQIQERNLDNIRKYQSLKKKPVSIAQARKNMIIYLKNMVGYKMEHFRGMTYDKEIHNEGSRTYWKIMRVSGITEAYQSFEDMLKGFNREDLVALWNLVKEKFSSTVPNVDKEKNLWVKLKRLFEPDVDDVLWKLQRHDMIMLTEKDYPLSNGVMILMLSAKLQVEEDNEMAKNLVIKIFMEANKPKSKILDNPILYWCCLAKVDAVQRLKENVLRD